MNSYNKAIRGVPIEQIQSIGGLLSLLNLVEVNHLKNNGLLLIKIKFLSNYLKIVSKYFNC